MYLMIVAGSYLDILANRLATLGHETTTEFNELERTLRVDCIQTYAKISRSVTNSYHFNIYESNSSLFFLI